MYIWLYITITVTHIIYTPLHIHHVISYMIRKIHLTKACVDTAGPVGSWRVGGLSSAACGSGKAASMWALVRTGWCGNENEKRWKNGTLQGTNISPKNGILKMIFLFPRWDMLIPWRVPHICLVATQIFFIFTPIWGNDPFWLIFFKGVENHQVDMVL